MITYTKVHGNDKNRGAVEGNLRPVDYYGKPDVIVLRDFVYQIKHATNFKNI